MPSTYDPLLRLELQATGENATTWGTKTNNNLDLIAAAIAGQAVVTVSSADVTLTEANAATDQSRAAILVFTGTMTGNVNIIVPSQTKTYAAFRQTTGAYNLVIKNATGTGATLPTSGTDIIVCTTATCVGLIGSLASQVAAVSAQVSTLDVRVTNVSASVSALNVQVADVSAKVSAVDVRVAAVSASVSALNVRVADVSASVSALNVQVAAVSAQVSALQVQVANVSAITSALDVRISAVSASVSVINTQLAAVSALVSSINSLDIRVIE